MGGVVGPEFAAVLRRNRETFNARFANARRSNRGLDGPVFAGYLRVCVEPAVTAAIRAGADDFEIDRLAVALYDIALDLVSADLAGPHGRYPVLSRMWVELLPLVVQHFAGRPRDAVAALSNAVANLSAEPGISPQAWLDGMLDIAPSVDSMQELLGAGQVLAWRLGMAHFREGALGVLDELGDELGRAAVGDTPDARQRWRITDESTLGVVAQVGEFIGLGGPFESPPEVLQADGHLFAFDNTACWTIHADRFGATLKRFARTLPEGEVLPARYSVQDGEVHCADHDSAFIPGGGMSSWACSDAMAVLTSAHSHRITVVALRTP